MNKEIIKKLSELNIYDLLKVYVYILKHKKRRL